MASTATAGVGTLFQKWISGAWSSIAEINSINGPGMSRDTIDVSSLSSTGGYREFIAGFRNPGTVALNLNFRRDTYEIFKADFESNVVQNYRIVLPDVENTIIDLMGLVTELPLTIPADDKVTCDVTIQLSGPIDVDSGASPLRGLP